MTADAIDLVPPAVRVVVTEDGMLVSLRGALSAQEAPALRAALLRRRPPGCDHVVVDAGSVVSADDSCLAVLLAASGWAHDTGGRLVFSRISGPLRATAAAAGLLPLLPPLPPLPRPGKLRVVPVPRGSGELPIGS